jgi:hypothetical protein
MSSLRTPLALILFFAVSITHAEELRTLSGKNVTGTLKRIDADNIVLDTDQGPVTTPLSQVLVLDLRPVQGASTVKYFDVRLLDDSNLLAKEITYSGKDAEVTLFSGDTLKVPLAAIVSVLKEAGNPTIRLKFQNAIKGKLRSDRIFIFKDGELNAIEGTLGDVDPDGKSIEFKRENSAGIKVAFERLQGLVFLRTEVPAESAVCKVLDQAGNTLAASKLGYDGTSLTVATPAGAKLVLKGDAVAKLDFNLGRLTYLSDLEPKVSESALFGGFRVVHKDVNQDGRPIVLLDKTFAKGLTLEGGATAVEYNLAGKYKDFKALIGADTRASEGAYGKTTVLIYCDGEKRLSETVAPSELRSIALNVKDVVTLKIVLDGTTFAVQPSYATLADARVSQ